MTSKNGGHEPDNLNSTRFRLGVDIGGTFTDGVLIDTSSGEVTNSKVLSTPGDPSLGFMEALQQLIAGSGIEPGEIEHVVHATTVATNAIIEGSTARAAFVTTAGFSDMLEIARQIRPTLYDLNFKKPPPLVPRRLCFGVPERLDAVGDVITPLDESSVEAIAELIAQANVESVAVCLLHAYRNPDHEARVGEILRSRLKDMPVSLSSEVAPEFREYFRASTTVINAVIGPLVGRYLSNIGRRLEDRGITGDLLVMQSSGGVYSAEAAVERPVFMVESGPAAGAVAATHIGAAAGHKNLISFDMGGTTAKVCMILGGEPRVTKDYTVGAEAQSGAGAFGGADGYPVRTPVIDLVEIGAGGGSIAWVDSGGALRVGPRSSGAEPGPACYGLGGTQPTITDANLVLGRLNPEYFAGGSMPLDPDLSAAAIKEHCADPLGMDVEAAADGIIEIANSMMVGALRLVSVQRGHDPRDFLLVAFGGAGPAHAARIAQDSGMAGVLIPPSPGTASALGLLATDLRLDRSATHLELADNVDAAELDRKFRTLEAESTSAFRANTSNGAGVNFRRSIEMRYYGQSFELDIPTPAGTLDEKGLSSVIAAFHEDHERAYGFKVPSEPVEFVNLRLVAVQPITKPATRPLSKTSGDESSGVKGRRRVFFAELGGWTDTAVYDRYAMNVSARLTGPTIIEEADSLTVVPPGWEAHVDELGNLILTHT